MEGKVPMEEELFQERILPRWTVQLHMLHATLPRISWQPGVADEILVQLSYAIGVVKPIGVFVNTFGKAKVDLTDGEIAKKIESLYDLRPAAIEQQLKLRNPIYLETASYGHMGRTPQTVTKTFTSQYWDDQVIEVELFTWEKLDFVDKFKNAFGIS